ncbi:hypothetical protein [Haloglomus litoreum]|uniref:hypothetical protein n=1 Tax=Haloglomus litoreum TaxID=3034026 RepID=UPI0023E89D53|nr:hypothetical protein [Haloglomus sp. DT116]
MLDVLGDELAGACGDLAVPPGVVGCDVQPLRNTLSPLTMVSLNSGAFTVGKLGGCVW